MLELRPELHEGWFDAAASELEVRKLGVVVLGGAIVAHDEVRNAIGLVEPVVDHLYDLVDGERVVVALDGLDLDLVFLGAIVIVELPP